jgi:hypothetical protein
MKITLVPDRHLASINTRLGEIEMKLSAAVTMMTEIKANLEEASAAFWLGMWLGALA